MAISFVERWLLHRGLNKKQFMDCPSGQRYVVIVEVWPLWGVGS